MESCPHSLHPLESGGQVFKLRSLESFQSSLLKGSKIVRLAVGGVKYK